MMLQKPQTKTVASHETAVDLGELDGAMPTEFNGKGTFP